MQRNLVLAGAVALLLGACAQIAQPPSQESLAGVETSSSTVVISEIRIDQPGTDLDEYVELEGPAGTSLTGLTYLVIGDGTGGSGVIEAVIDLTGSTIGASGRFVIAESTFTLGTPDLVTVLNFENSDNVTHLLVSGFSGVDGSDLDTNDDGVLDVSPWTAVIDLIALVKEANPPTTTEYHYGPPAIGPDGAFVPGHVYRCADGWRIGPFDPTGGSDSPGGANPCDVIGSCGDAATPISAIQGDGMVGPLTGVTVVIEGIVVGDFQANDGDAFGTNLGGFYVQEEPADQDADPGTSEGVFVNAPGADDVAVGDVVRVLGRAWESSGLTQLDSVSDVLSCGAAATLPPATQITLPVASLDDLESFEGMLVTFPQDLVISEYFNFDRYGEIVLALPPMGLARPFQGTSYKTPGPDAEAVTAANLLARITLDDGRSNQNPSPPIHPNGAAFTLDNRFRGGDLVTDATGVLDYRFNLYRIQPTAGATYTASNPRTDAPAATGGTMTVAAFNVLNYFSTLDLGPDICGPLADQECRGADNAEEFDRQRSKIIAALAAIDADVVGLIEIENGGDALADLVDGLNEEMGADTYAAIETGPIGPDAIRVALIFQPARVAPIGGFAVLDTPEFLDPTDSGTAANRPALAQTFADVTLDGGGAVTVVVNHLKSKGSACGLGDDDPIQGNCNLTRTLAVERLLEWIATDPTGALDPDVLLIGDYNAYDEEDPIAAFAAAGVTDLLEAYVGEYAYTYVFDGQFGHLDYALATSTLTPQVSGATAWAINADEPDILDYDTGFKQPAEDALFAPDPYRSSDHDPVIVGLALNASPVCSGATASVSSLWPADHKLVAASILGVTDPEGDDVTITIDSIFQDEPVDAADNDGSFAPDAFIGLGNAFEVRAERSGEGNGRVYHVTFTATDATGSCSGEVLIEAPLSRGKKVVTIDDGALYDSTLY